MTPTNLGALPSTEPLRNGKVQIKRGGVDASNNYSNANAGQIITDNAGGYMQISCTPVYPCWWIVHSNLMSHGYPDGSGWRRWDHQIVISPADARGITVGHQLPHQNYDNSTVEWRSVGTSVAFQLNAGILYTASLVTSYCSAGTVQVHTGPQWARILGRIVGEGVV